MSRNVRRTVFLVCWARKEQAVGGMCQIAAILLAPAFLLVIETGPPELLDGDYCSSPGAKEVYEEGNFCHL